MPLKVLFILPHSINIGPSQRFRVGLFLPFLKEAGIRYTLRNFYSERSEKILYEPGHHAQKIWTVVKGFLKRTYTVLFEAPAHDYIFIQRGSAPLGPPVFEWLLTKLLRKKVIFDYDDAIWKLETSKENKLASWFKATWKVKYICKWSYKVVGGNEYLCDYARQYNPNVFKIPTCVDTERYHNRLKVQRPDAKPVIGWTGSHTTLPYLKPIVPVINELQQEMPFTFLVICNKPPVWDVADWTFVPWRGETEVADLLRMDIGVMPLKEDAWTEGKCGFKLVQYLSLGIPAVASPAGVNKQIVKNGVEGFLCETGEQWKEALRKLLLDADLRQKMGSRGRKTVEEGYSIRSQAAAFIGLFR